MGRTLPGSTSSWSYVMRCSRMSAVICCASVRDRIHSSSSKVANREDIEHPKQPPPLSSASKSNDGIQVFLTPAKRAWSTHGCQLDMWERRCCCFAAPLFLFTLRSSLISLGWSSKKSGLWSTASDILLNAAQPTSPFIALLIDPVAVRAQYFSPAFLRSADAWFSFL